MAFLNPTFTYTLHFQGFSIYISNDDKINDQIVTRENEIKNKHNISKSSLQSFMYNLTRSLGVDIGISKKCFKLNILQQSWQE